MDYSLLTISYSLLSCTRGWEEGVGDVDELVVAFRAGDCYDVELIVERHALCLEEGVGGSHHVSALGGIHCIHGVEASCRTCLHLDEHHAPPHMRYDVDLTAGTVPLAFDNGRSQRHEIIRSNLFAPVAFTFR